MCSQIRCPYCHSHDVELETTYEEMVKETQEQLKELEKHPEREIGNIKEVMKEILLYNPYEDDEYLDRLDKKGFEYQCLDCGCIFYEKEKYDEDVLLHDEITKEEYISIVCDAIEKYLPKDHNEKMKKMVPFIISKNRKKFYREMAIDEVEEIKENAKMFYNELEEEKSIIS